METVIKQNGLDIEALTSSRLPNVAGTQVGESGPSQGAGRSHYWIIYAIDLISVFSTKLFRWPIDMFGRG